MEGQSTAKILWAAPDKWFDAEGYYYKGKTGKQSAYRMMGVADDTKPTKKKKLIVKESTFVQTQIGDSLGIFKI